ncbi:reverse transcriptase domain-containing protein [Tanacetum coccineum]
MHYGGSTESVDCRSSSVGPVVAMSVVARSPSHSIVPATKFLDFALNIVRCSWEILVKSPYFALEVDIPEEDVEPKQIILDPDDQSMRESAKTVAPTPNSAIVQINVDDNFVINSTHLKMIRENKFNGYLRADPYDHIREFLAICNMFRYGKTQSEAVKLLIFPYSLSDKAKTWFNELNEESIISWEQMRRAFINRFFPSSLLNRLLLEIRNFSQNICESLAEAWLRLKNMLRKCHGHGLTKGAIIQIFYHVLDEPTQGIMYITAGGIFLYKSPNQAFQFLEDKVLFEHDWAIKSKNEHHQKSVSFTDGSDSNTDNSRFGEKLKAIDSQIISLNEELQDMQLNNDVRNDLEDFKRRIRSMRTVHWKLYDSDDRKTTGILPNKKSKTVNQEPQTKTDLEKSVTKFLDGQRVSNMFFKNNVNDMILKMKQNEKNFQIKIKMMERKMDEWSKSQNISLEQTDWTEPQPPPQAQTEQVNVVFTGSGKSDDSPKTQKDPPPPIIVDNKTEKDKPIKTSKKGYHVEFGYPSLIPKIIDAFSLFELRNEQSCVSILSLRMCTYGLCRLFWDIGIGIKLYEWAGNLVALELVLDHHLLDRGEVNL